MPAKGCKQLLPVEAIASSSPHYMLDQLTKHRAVLPVTKVQGQGAGAK